MSAPDLLRLLSPVVLAPVLIWIGYRYLPLLAGCGRARLYLLVFLCTGAVAVQAGLIHTGAYPLVTWTMYGQAAVSSDTWRFMALGEEGEWRFPWEEVAPVREIRAFDQHFMHLAGDVERASDEGERLERIADLERILGRVIDAYNERARGARVEAVRVDRCRVDIREPRRRGEVECEPFLTVPARAPHAP